MYHNKRFKEEAEKRGLVIEKHPTYGWTITIPSKELCDWLEQTGFSDIKIGRIESAYGLDGSGGGLAYTVQMYFKSALLKEAVGGVGEAGRV